jgi:hypothetical protein
VFHAKSINEQPAALKDTLRMRKINPATWKIKFVKKEMNLKFNVLTQKIFYFGRLLNGTS